MSIESPNKPINWAAIQELVSADDAALLKMLEGAAAADVTLNEGDIEGIRGAATDLAAASTTKMSAAEAFASAYKSHVHPATYSAEEISLDTIGNGVLGHFSNDQIRAIMSSPEGAPLTDEEIEKLRGLDVHPSEESDDESTKDSSFLLVNPDGTVAARVNSRAELYRRVQEEQANKDTGN